MKQYSIEFHFANQPRWVCYVFAESSFAAVHDFMTENRKLLKNLEIITIICNELP